MYVRVYCSAHVQEILTALTYGLSSKNFLYMCTTVCTYIHVMYVHIYLHSEVYQAVQY